MRGNNRKSIEKCRKRLPQFTTMNVIDGQAGLVIYSSLIFYSLTIDNILNIVVLLILAGISISMLTGQNGILNRAQEAKEKTEVAGEDELRKLTQIQAAMNLEDTTYKDNSTGEEKTVTIPSQCAVSQVGGENTLKDGLVIIDSNGNEWVWVEVPESVTASATTDDEIKNALITYAIDYRNINYSDTWYEGCGLEEKEYNKKYSEMLQSIKENGGFYIGRYEVGSFDNPVTVEDTTRTAVIQQGAYPYNYVTCSQAEKLAEEFSVSEKTSTLMFGIQWDLVLKYIELKNPIFGDSNKSAQDKLKSDSSSWGNYRNAEFMVKEGKYTIVNNFEFENWNLIDESFHKAIYNEDGNGVILSTGSTERNSVLNVYDLSGNLYEWTLEKFTGTRLCTYRGGCGFYEGSIPSSSRGGFETFVIKNRLGFRVTLY